MLSTLSCRRSLPFFAPPFGRTFARTSLKWSPRVSRVSRNALNDATMSRRVAETDKVKTFSERVGQPRVFPQAVYVFGLSLGVFMIAAEDTRIENEYWSQEIKKFMGMWTFREPSPDDLRKIRARALVTSFLKHLESVKEKISQWPITVQNITLTMSALVGTFFFDASEGRRLCWWICASNAFVFLLWKIPRLSPFMNRAFTHDPLSGRSYTLSTSMFSHKSFLHLAANSMALASFGAAATHYMCVAPQREPDITGGPQFLAFYIAAGLFSGLVSHVVSAKILYPRMLSYVTKQAAVRMSPAASSLINEGTQEAPRKILPSLGASGAIYAAVTLTALAFPDAQVQPIFVPISVPITTGVGALVLMDIVGAIRGWKLFDHYAHLGGAAFGVLYYAYGTDFWTFIKEHHRKLTHIETS